MQRVSIIIPNWNGKEFLKDCLPALDKALAGHPEATEIIVVDNGSTDGSVDFLRGEFPAVRVVEFDENKGFAFACNEGAAQASHDLLLFLNNDVVVTPHFLGPLVSHFRRVKDLFAVSCKILFGETWTLNIGRTCARFHRGYFQVLFQEDAFASACYTLFASGAASLVDRSKFLELRGFDTNFFYFEDVDLGYRAWKRGWRIVYEPGSVVHHKALATSQRLFTMKQIEETTTRNTFLFMWKNVTDVRLILFQLFQLPLLLSIAAARGNWHVWRGLWKAFRDRGSALRLRPREKRESTLTDAEVLRLCQGEIGRV